MKYNYYTHKTLETYLPKNWLGKSIYTDPATPALELIKFTGLKNIQKNNIKTNTRTELDLIIDLNYKNKNIENYVTKLKKKGIIVLKLRNNTQFKLFKKDTSFLEMIDYLEKNNYFPLFREYVGKPTTANRILSQKLLNLLPSSRLFSGYSIVIYQHTKSSQKYINKNSLNSKIKRLFQRNIQKSKYLSFIFQKLRISFNYSVNIKKEVTGKNKKSFDESTKKLIKKITNKKIRLLIVMAWLEIGGVERVILNLIKSLNADIFDIYIITTVKSSNPWNSEFKKYCTEIIHLPDALNKIWQKKYINKYIAFFVDFFEINRILITNSTIGYQATPVIKNKNPEIKIYDLLHTHGTPLDDDAFLKISIPYDSYIEKRIVIDEYLKRYYLNKYSIDKNKIVVIYNGIDNELKAYDIKKEEGNKIIGRENSNQIIISYVGRLEIDKSPLRLVEIANKLNRNLSTKDVKISIVGDGLERKSMEELANRYKLDKKILRFCGYSNNSLAAAKSSNFTILTSDAEGIPMAILESMSVGTPTIAPAVGGIPEIISDKKDGFLVDINKCINESAKIDAFCKIIESAALINGDKYTNMSLNSQKKIKEKFSSMGSDYQKLFLNEK